MKYMKKLILWMPAAALLMTGCGSMVSVSPLYSDETVTQDAGLIGTWQASTGDDILLVRQGDNKTYQALYTSMKDSASTMLFQVQLVKLQGSLFADLVRDTSGWTIPGHVFAKISLDGDALSVSFLDSDWLKQQILSGSRQNSNFVVLPGSTAALQQMVSKYGDDPRAIDGGTEFQRLH
jgi:hypothetical protein